MASLTSLRHVNTTLNFIHTKRTVYPQFSSCVSWNDRKKICRKDFEIHNSRHIPTTVTCQNNGWFKGGDSNLIAMRNELLSQSPIINSNNRLVSRVKKVSPRCLLPQVYTYSSKMGDVDEVQLSTLWAKTLQEAVPRTPAKIRKAMLHSYAFIIVKDEGALSATGCKGKIIGVGRAVSDGAFIATICDVAVDPDYQRRGIGRKIVKRIVQDVKGRGPTGFAVFPPPLARRFFWMIGFRADKKYCIMAYKLGNKEEAAFVSQNEAILEANSSESTRRHLGMQEGSADEQCKVEAIGSLSG